MTKSRVSRIPNSVRLAGIFVLLLMCSTVYAAKVYKWTDSEGNVQFTQHPPPGKAEEINVKTSAPDAEEKTEDQKKAEDATENQEAPPESPDTAESTEGEKKKGPMTEEEFAALKQEKEAELRKKNCEIANKRFATISKGGRLYEVDGKGERSYWDDDTRAAKLQEAQDDLQKWCQE